MFVVIQDIIESSEDLVPEACFEMKLVFHSPLEDFEEGGLLDLHHFHCWEYAWILEWGETFEDLKKAIAKEIGTASANLELKYRRILRSKAGKVLSDGSTPAIEGMKNGREGTNNVLVIVHL